MSLRAVTVVKGEILSGEPAYARYRGDIRYNGGGADFTVCFCRLEVLKRQIHLGSYSKDLFEEKKDSIRRL